MLQIKNIKKQYKTGELVQMALNDVSLSFRDNEFVAILGPSGSGKTTLLNIIGGLDRYDSGDLIINGVTTKKYNDRDWDSYRNHTIGFVFQSYNLIPHQSVLANVELALTISGISSKERRARAKQALEKVGLGDQLHKKPNQMSGGQMQRVAIARALVNNPDILLADEPTGALDTATSIQVMELLKEVAKDKLVVMVTHNPELADKYANRIVKLRDGVITDDSNPFNPDEKETVSRNLGRAHMSRLTALELSFNNLRTKKARTLLTSFAGSIGIIGIALILALSTGVNAYIENLQKDTMGSYPITISAKTVDMSSMINVRNDIMGGTLTDANPEQQGKLYSDSRAIQVVSEMTSSIVENDLTAFKKYLDDPNSSIAQYIGENGVVYSYNTKFKVYTEDENGNYLDTNRELDEKQENNEMFSYMKNNMDIMNSFVGGGTSGTDNFTELTTDNKSGGVSRVVTDRYEVIYGRYPTEYNEVVLIANSSNAIDTSILCQLGIITDKQYKDIKKQIDNGDEVTELNFDYADICDKKFKLLTASDFYSESSDGRFKYIGDDDAAVNGLMDSALELKIVGIIKPTEDNNTNTTAVVGYTSKLTDYIISHTNNSAVVKAQESNKDINVLNGMAFESPDDSAKIEAAKKYLSNLGVSDKATAFMMIQFMGQNKTDTTVTENNTQTGAMPDMSMGMQGMGAADGGSSEAALAAALDMWIANTPDDDVLLSVYEKNIEGGSYEDNLSDFGKISYDAPSAINIYCDTFEAKDGIASGISEYNSTVPEEKKITYTDYVALLTSSITSMVDIVSYVLIAFVAVSLVVSCIMIAIITHISVMERTKEIGILRAIGASKRNISQVFNAETFIIGICAGILGVGVSELLLIPINAIIHMLVKSNDINAQLPLVSGVILVVISILITFIGGIIPAKKAAKKDPVIALRTE